MEEYISYGKIEQHMQISESLYEMDLLGKHFIEEIKANKNTKIGRRGLILRKEYDTILTSINETINLRRFKSRLFLTLQYYLDEAMFDVVPESIECFFIEDDKYDLTKLYFDQEQWIRHNGIQRFSLTKNVDLVIDEALLINCFFMKYETLLKDIERLVMDVSEDKRYKRKILQVITKIRAKHNPSISIIEATINEDSDDPKKIESDLKKVTPLINSSSNQAT